MSVQVECATPTVRLAEGRDISELVRLVLRQREEECTLVPSLLLDPLECLERITRYLRSPFCTIVVADIGDGEISNLVGFVAAELKPCVGTDVNTGTVHDSYTEKEYRHWAVMGGRHILQWAKSFGIMRLQICTLTGNKYVERLVAKRARPISTVYEMNLISE